jgi:hypothetical protein
MPSDVATALVDDARVERLATALARRPADRARPA